ncbi:MAG: hypothetical protein SQA66_10690, partial [Candidatus Fervidibacter sacchari]
FLRFFRSIPDLPICRPNDLPINLAQQEPRPPIFPLSRVTCPNLPIGENVAPNGAPNRTAANSEWRLVCGRGVSPKL